jgi:thioredoxin-like negative regulator of GroEL
MGIIAAMKAKSMKPKTGSEANEDFEFWNEQADLYFTQSLELKEEVFNNHPVTADTHFNLAKFYIQNSKQDKASDHLEKCVKIYHKYVTAGESFKNKPSRG